MKLSFITTVLNEEKNIDRLMSSILSQTKKVDEIIIVDGGSTDATISKIKNQKSKIKNSIKFEVIVKRGNRSIGRNEAIKRAKGDIILCSDAGCILDKKWVEKIIEPFKNKTVDVVAGYYKAKTKTVFQRCLVPYVLVMQDRVNPATFLPASRSMAIRKRIWKKVGGFPEYFFHNEDYVFAQKLKKNNSNIVFVKNAIVYWMPRENFWQSFVMFYRFAFGDGEAGILRGKVIILLLRYAFAVFCLLLLAVTRTYALLLSTILLFLLYSIWSVWKNFSYIKDIRGIFILPTLQVVSDIAVLFGTLFGLVTSIIAPAKKQK